MSKPTTIDARILRAVNGTAPIHVHDLALCVIPGLEDKERATALTGAWYVLSRVKALCKAGALNMQDGQVTPRKAA